jgi:hypothetical protein
MVIITIITTIVIIIIMVVTETRIVGTIQEVIGIDILMDMVIATIVTTTLLEL